MAKDPAVLFYTSDFLTGVSDLTMEERGQYITLLCLQHQKGRLSKKMITIAAASVSDDVLSKFKIDESGLYYNSRLELEAHKRAEHARKQSERAKKGWEKRKKEKQSPPVATANATALPLENENENESRIKNKDVNKSLSKVSLSDFPFTSSNFLKAWKAWLEHKLEIKKPYKTERGEKMTLKKLARESGTEEIAIITIEHSIAREWEGLHKPKNNDTNRKKGGFDPSNFTAEGIHKIIHKKSATSG